LVDNNRAYLCPFKPKGIPRGGLWSLDELLYHSTEKNVSFQKNS
jgi:hypothetical protein